MSQRGLELLKQKGWIPKKKEQKSICLLAIDPAQKTGWAISTKIFGTWDFKIGRDESFSYKLLKFKSKLNELIKMEGIKTVVFERPSGHHANAVISHSKFVAVIEMFCTENDIPYKGYSANEIKKFATGKGNSNKEKMIAAARLKLGYIGEDDNEVDAMWLWLLAKADLKL